MPAMSKYMVLIPDDYREWAAATEQQRQAMYAQHEKFAARLAEGGHTFEGGSELRDPSTAKTVRVVDGEPVITDGPYSEAVEQISGFYLVETENLDDLLQACALIATSGAIEVRECGSAVES
jgi:hypothetical protein